ncbi:MAG: hypothetical protein RL120_00125 [Gammaproteobacteria bacterium]
MKKLLLSLSVIAALVASQSAFADHRYYRGYNHHRSGAYWGVSFGNHYGYNRYHRHGHYDGGAFVGGLVLGSLLSYPSYTSSRYETVRYVKRPVVRSREVVYVRQAATRTQATGRRLLRDLDGNCFERVIDASGDEIRVQLDPAECVF